MDKKLLGGCITQASINGFIGWTARGVGITFNTKLVDATGRSESKPLVDGNDNGGQDVSGGRRRRDLVNGGGSPGAQIVHGTLYVERLVKIIRLTRCGGKHNVHETQIIFIVGVDGIQEREIYTPLEKVASVGLNSR